MNAVKKLLLSVQIAAAFAAALCISAGAEQIYGGDFLKTKYTVYDSAIAGEKTDGNVAISQDALPGKTEISFDFSINSGFTGASADITARRLGKSDVGVPVSLALSKVDDTAFSLACGGETIADLLEFGKTYSLVVQLDLNGGKYNVHLYENQEKNRLVAYKSGLGTESGFSDYGVTGVSFGGDISVSHLTAFRERAAENVPVTDIGSSIVTVSTALSQDIEKGDYYDIYAAFYKDAEKTELADALKKTYRCYDNYAEAIFDLSGSFLNPDYYISVYALRSSNIAPLALSGRPSEDDSSGVAFNMECSQRTSWYTLGESVTYTLASGAATDSVSKICGAVYNSNGAPVYSAAVDLAQVQSGGWTYTPAQSGYYKVIFYALTKNNRVVYEHRQYDTIYDKYLGGVKLDKSGHNFYVTAFENKDWENRNKRYGMSIDRYDGEYDLDIAKQLGMSFVRLHAFSWKDIQPTQDGDLVWTKTTGATHQYERIFDRIAAQDRFDVIANILYTPLWASSNKDETENHYDLPEYATHAPSDNKFLTDFIDRLYEKYGRYITAWEIYNEPNVNNSSGFWHDTTENYVSMLGAAYNEIKALSAADASKSEPDTVVMGGIGSYYLAFYRDFLENGGWRYTDKIALHGYDIRPWNFTQAYKQYAQSDNIGTVDTEAHMMLFSRQSDNFIYTEKQLALRTLKEFLRQIKYDVERIAFFQAYENHVMGEDIMKFNDAYSNGDTQWSIVMAGLYRKKPSFEPRFAAGALNTLIAKSGSVTEYADEYKTGNINIVRLTADGNPVYVLWGDDLAAQSADADLSGITYGAVITDWEGRVVSADGFAALADEVYFIEGLSDSAFSYLGSAKGTEPYLGEVLYSEYEKSARACEGPVYQHTDAPLYNAETASINTADAKWNDVYAYDLNGNPTDNLPKGQLAVHVSNDGLECVMKVSNTNDSGESMPTVKAEMLVGMDTAGNGAAGYSIQFTAKFTPQYSTGMRVYKSVLPYTGGDIIDNTDVNVDIADAKMYIVEGDGCKYFYMFMPAIELYPFDCGSNYKVNIGVQFKGFQTNVGGDNVSTFLRTNGNESYDIYKPWQFASIQYAEQPATTDISKGIVNEVVNAKAGEYVSAKILCNDEIIYVNQYVADADGRCKISAVVSGGEGSYVLKTYSDSVGYTTISLN